MKRDLITTRLRIDRRDWFIVAGDRTGRQIKDTIVVPHSPVSFDSDAVWQAHVHGFELFCRVFELHGRVRYAKQDCVTYVWLWADVAGHFLSLPEPLEPAKLAFISSGEGEGDSHGG